jgi:hypothetical protein
MLTLTACSSIPKIFQTDTVPIERPALVLPQVDQFHARDVSWIIITPENVNQIFADLQDSNKSLVVFGLTDDGYQNISLNITDILKLVQQQRAIIAAYKDYYETTQ